MREPLDLERPREQVCPICHDHGWYRGSSGRRIPCDTCAVGQGIIATGVARELLRQVYSTRDSDLFLESRSPTFGGLRPKELLREGGARAESVLAAIERIPGVRKRDPATQVPYATQVQGGPVKIEKPPEDEGAVRRVLAAKARQYGEHQVARALELRTTDDLSEREHALFDAAFAGNGYLVDGKRVDPTSVEIFRWPA